jgi:long-chain acyl-CoA synthetase
MGAGAQSFWDALGIHGDAVALIDAASGEYCTYARLDRAVARVAARFASAGRRVALLVIENSLDSVVNYLGLLRAGHAVILSGAKEDWVSTQALIGRFQPDLLFLPPQRSPSEAEGYGRGEASGTCAVWESRRPHEPPGENLALVLSTSGSSGFAKHVRLSRTAIGMAALQVRQALDVTGADRAVTSLPLDHVYGLSVLHSHLASGGSLLLEPRSVLDPHFWQDLRTHDVTSLSGVPWTFDIMRRLKLAPSQLPRLNKLTQSGGHLPAPVRDWFLDRFVTDTISLYLMYGQTEAGGRICVLPPRLLREKSGSVGLPVPSGRVLCGDDGALTYLGANVMLGYARTRADLMRGDEMNGRLSTGDLGRIDEGGFLYLSGRSGRIHKILGRRIDLEEVQDVFSSLGEVSVVFDDGTISIFAEGVALSALRDRAAQLAGMLRLPRHVIRAAVVPALTRSRAGKVLNRRPLQTGPEEFRTPADCPGEI